MEDIISAATMDTIGLKTAVCDVNNIKKARYTLQVIAVVLTRLLREAFDSINDNDASLENGIESQQGLVMFNYWFNILHYIKVVLLIVRSFREASIDLLIIALENIVTLFFALDHVIILVGCQFLFMTSNSFTLKCLHCTKNLKMAILL